MCVRVCGGGYVCLYVTASQSDIQPASEQTGT